VLAPIIAGFLFTAGYSLPTVALTMAIGSLLAACVLLLLKLDSERPVAQRAGSGRQPIGATPVPADSRAR
jgi:hypothetical protein